MIANKYNLTEIHKLCFENEARLKVAKKAGCFDCVSIFSTSEVNQWIDDKLFRTALCPKCFTDAVLADDGDISLSMEILQAMHEKYFSSYSGSDGVKQYETFSDLLNEYKQKIF